MPFLILGVFVLSLFCLERVCPLRRITSRTTQRILVNLLISLLTFAVAFCIIRPVVDFLFHLEGSRQFGIISLLNISGPLEIIVGIVLLDLSFYYWHVLNHKVSVLWRFHNVHHIDPDLDVTTAFRFHPGEVAISTIFRSLQVVLIGVSFETFVLYEFVFQAFTYFEHANIRFPLRVEKILNLFIVTPRMHGIHHSNYKSETNSNYSVVFSIWDRLHKSLNLNVSQEAVTIGVPGYSRKEDNHIVQVLTCRWRRNEIIGRIPQEIYGFKGPK